MSYCRWSCDDFRCDLYVIDSCYGYVVHIAGNRVEYDRVLPKPQPFTAQNMKAWKRRHDKVMRWLKKARRVPITLPHAGESFTYETPGELADFLRELKSLGYRFPDHVITTLDEEEKEK